LIDEAFKEGREMEYCDGLFNVEGSHTLVDVNYLRME